MAPNDGPPELSTEALVQLRRVLIAQVNRLSDALGLPHVHSARDDTDARRRGVDRGGRPPGLDKPPDSR